MAEVPQVVQRQCTSPRDREDSTGSAHRQDHRCPSFDKTPNDNHSELTATVGGPSGALSRWSGRSDSCVATPSTNGPNSTENVEGPQIQHFDQVQMCSCITTQSTTIQTVQKTVEVQQNHDRERVVHVPVAMQRQALTIKTAQRVVDGRRWQITW